MLVKLEIAKIKEITDDHNNNCYILVAISPNENEAFKFWSLTKKWVSLEGATLFYEQDKESIEMPKYLDWKLNWIKLSNTAPEGIDLNLNLW